ncbi:MAG: aminoacyl-tRNA hydrolase [bacterium]|nr:aminoacyl-tRNA hydrolase [bacterium]
MILVVGLGNPGKKYEKTRHNVGSRVVDELRSSSRFANARVIDELEVLDLKNVILVKPKTFMNESGKAVKPLIEKYKIKPEDLIVIHDDIDLPLRKIRIVKNRGSAGHKGVESIIRELKTENFIRFRIGIQPQSGKPKNPENFVLQKFNKEEKKIVEEVIKKTAEAIKKILQDGLEKTMNEFNN